MSELSQFLHMPGVSELTPGQIEKISYFLQSPGKNEFFILLQMLGKTPVQVRDIMIDEFIRRFGLEAYSDQIRNALSSKQSWQALDMALIEIAGLMDVEEHVRFWKGMRSVFDAIPQSKQHEDANKDKTRIPQRGWGYTICKFCWRRAAFNSGAIRKTGSFCFKHNLPAMHPLYRKHRRLEKHLAVEQQPILKKLTALVETCPPEKDSQALVISQLTAPDTCLPRLAAYLGGTGHDNTPESLLWAFHGPAWEITDSRYKEALNEYIQRTVDAHTVRDPAHPMPIFTMDELSRAEAWLILLENDRRMKNS